MMAKRVANLIVLACLGGGTAVPLTGQTVVTPLLSVGNIRPIPPALLGVNTRAKVTGLWKNAVDQTNLKRLAVEHLRFPGGIVANYYDWTTGDMITPDEPHPHHTIDVENYRMAQLLTAYQTTGVEPVFVLNLVTSHRIAGYASALESQLAMLRHAQQIGLPVDRIELGNELYSPMYDEQTYSLGEVNMRGFLDAADYYSTASNWATQIKAEFPAAKIAPVDTVIRSSDVANLNRKYFWNRDLNAMDLSAFDALVRHDYSAAGLLDPQNASGSLEELQQQQWELFLAPGGPDKVIGTAFSYMDDIAQNTQQTDGMPTWITEFNLMDKVGPVARTWSQALFSAAMLYNMFDDPSIELISSHSFHGHKFGAVFFEDDEFPYMRIDLGYSLATTPGELSANGLFLSTVNGAVASMTQLAPLNFGQVPVVGELDADVVDHPALVGYLLQNDYDQRMLLTNFSSQELVIDLATMPGTWHRALILSADPRQHILKESDVNRSHTSLGSQLTLPAYSLAVVTVPEPEGLVTFSVSLVLGAFWLASSRGRSPRTRASARKQARSARGQQ
jgi:hypothetical protein